MAIANGTYVSFCNQPKAHFGGSVMEVHHPVFYVSLGHMQNNMRSSVTLKLKLTLTLTLTLTDTGGAAQTCFVLFLLCL